MERFPPGVVEHLGWYVYRLVDPRNGETFYVGKGHGHRILEHAKGAISAIDDENLDDLKFRKIRDISGAGLEVIQIVHRHRIDTEEIAYEIEAALIDAYPGLANRVAGHGSGDYGCRSLQEIVIEYAAEPFLVHEPLILINVTKSLQERSTYDAVRAAWRITENNAQKFNLVLAHKAGLVCGAYRPTKWLVATKANFPWLAEDLPDRIGFEGTEAEQAVAELYVQKRVPDQYRKKGAANPVRFVPTTS